MAGKPGQGRETVMNAPAWIALGAAILIGIQTGMKIREHLIDYPIRKPKEDPEPPEGN